MLQEKRGGAVRTFTYDNLYRLTQETFPGTGGAATSYGYTYDKNGNRTKRETRLNGSLAHTDYYKYGPRNELQWVNYADRTPTATQGQPFRLYSYDLNGRPFQVQHRDTSTTTTSRALIDQYGWDSTGKLRRVTYAAPQNTTRTYTAEYDTGGTRVAAQLDGVSHVYSYGAGLLHDSAGNTAYTPGLAQRKNNVTTYLHGDRQGSTRTVNTNQKYEYDAFGNPTSTSMPDTPFRYNGRQGYQSDAPVGLQLLGARYYDPAVGRFISPDPIGYAGGLNLYNYCQGDPVNCSDPSGLLGVYDDDDSPANDVAFTSRMYAVDPGGVKTAMRAWEGTFGSMPGFSTVYNLATAATGYNGFGCHLEGGERLTRGIVGGIELAAVGLGRLGQAAETAAEGAQATAGPSRTSLYHFTDAKGLVGILESNQLLPSGPRATYGVGHYFTDIPPEIGIHWGTIAEARTLGKVSASELAKHLWGMLSRTWRLTHYLEIDVSGLGVIDRGGNIFHLPGTDALQLAGRIVRSGATPR